MKLDELKDQARKVGHTGRLFRDTYASSQALADLIGGLKAEDQRERKRFRKTLAFFVAAGVIYMLLFALTWIAPPDDSPEWHRFLLSLLGLLFLSSAFVSGMKLHELAGIDYAQPIGSFLKGVERRYKPVNVRDVVIGATSFAAFSVTGALGWLSAKNRYFPSMDQGTALLLYGGVLAVALVVGLIVGVSEWKKRKAPLLRQVREMKAELDTLESDTANTEPS